MGKAVKESSRKYGDLGQPDSVEKNSKNFYIRKK